MSQLERLRAATNEPTRSGARVPQLERSPHATTREKPMHRNEEPACLNERSCVPQLRLDAAKKKKKKKKNSQMGSLKAPV